MSLVFCIFPVIRVLPGALLPGWACQNLETIPVLCKNRILNIETLSGYFSIAFQNVCGSMDSFVVVSHFGFGCETGLFAGLDSGAGLFF